MMNFTPPAIFVNHVNTLQTKDFTRMELCERHQDSPGSAFVDDTRASFVVPNEVMVQLRDLLVKIFPKLGEGN